MKVFILIILVHWVADFIFQPHSWAKNKSSSWKALLSHTFLYTIIWMIPVAIVNDGDLRVIPFLGLTFLFHTITDYFTSRVVKQKFEEEDFGNSIPNDGAFTVIGFDQVLHYLQLILTWNYLFGI